MKEYIKIETPFERDTMGSKKLIEGKWRNETIEYLRNAWWVFTEKIDGTNVSVAWDGHKVEFHGRTERAQIPAQRAVWRRGQRRAVRADFWRDPNDSVRRGLRSQDTEWRSIQR